MLVPQPQGKERVSFKRKELPFITGLPSFSPPTDPARERIRASLPSAAWLSAYTLVFLVGAFTAFSRRTI
jgi:hypothetical protein